MGGAPAKALEEFYVAMFALMLQGSQANSRKKFEQVIANVRNVRDVWKQVAADPGSQRSAIPSPESIIGVATQRNDARTAASWTA